MRAQCTSSWSGLNAVPAHAQRWNTDLTVYFLRVFSNNPPLHISSDDSNVELGVIPGLTMLMAMMLVPSMTEPSYLIACFHIFVKLLCLIYT